jgi:hypothetical protein
MNLAVRYGTVLVDADEGQGFPSLVSSEGNRYRSLSNASCMSKTGLIVSGTRSEVNLIRAKLAMGGAEPAHAYGKPAKPSRAGLNRPTGFVAVDRQGGF